MEKVIFSETTYEALVKHLSDMEENQNNIIEEFSLKPPGEYCALTNIFKEYLNELRQILQTAGKSPAPNDSMPLITVGSKVGLRNIDNSKEYTFHIVSPNHKRSNASVVSCLSPVGKSLLLKKPGDTVKVEAPRGIFNYKVESIEYVGEE